ncbi:MAG: metallophosphoesterase [Flavobacteriales bacterium]
MNRTLVIGDLHGGLKGLIQAIERVKIQKTDTLIFLGDYVDGWSEASETIEYLIQLSRNHKCIFIMGNHDLWCKRWILKGDSNPIWRAHGGDETIESYKKTGHFMEESHRIFFQDLKPYYLDDQNRLFIHAGFTSLEGVEFEENENEYYFDRTLWETALQMKSIEKDKLAFMPSRLNIYKEVYIGHTPTTNYDSLVPMNAHSIWNIDTGAGFKGKVTILDIETKEFWQSDEVWTLYPYELGRN